MVHHIVLWAFKSSVSIAEQTAVLDAISGQKGTNPHVGRITAGPNMSHSRQSGFTHGYWSAFANREELGRYQAYPDHEAVAARLRESAEKLIVLDLEEVGPSG